MLLYNSFRVILVFVVLRTTDSARKIQDGHNVNTTMNYMVYIIKPFDPWLCGGAIVSPYFIVTSAACVQGHQFFYAVAGYKKYVDFKHLAIDECTKASRKKIIETRVPRSYDDADDVEKWNSMDIAAVKVESPYDFSAASPLRGCSWVPGAIVVNTESKFATPGTDAMALGWGHKYKWRQQDDPTDHNEEILQYSPILLMEKEECKKQYKRFEQVYPIIDRYNMLCSINEGNINEKGDLITKGKPTADGCVGKALRVGGECGEPVQDTLKPEQDKRPTQRPQPSAVDDGEIAYDDIAFNLRRQDGNMTANTTSYNYTRKAGICQNDQGGPLVTWVGKHQVLIGVSSVYKIDKELNCIGPYLYTSTHCHPFITCVISSDMNYTETKFKTVLGEVHATTPVIEDTGERAKGSKEFLNFKETPDENKDSGFLYDTHEQDQNNGHDNIYDDSSYYDSYQSDDGSSLRPPLFKETLQDPNKKDEPFRVFVRCVICIICGVILFSLFYYYFT